MLRFHNWRGWWSRTRANKFPAGRKQSDIRMRENCFRRIGRLPNKTIWSEICVFPYYFFHLNTIWQWLKWYKLHSLFAFIQFGSFRCLQSVLMVQKRCFDWEVSLKENIKTFSAFLAFVEGRKSCPCIVAKREKSKYRINFVNTKVFFPSSVAHFCTIFSVFHQA